MKRVYDAASRHKIIEGRSPLTELTEKLGIDAPQRVKNWDTRGASAEAMLLIQAKTGINATWIESGEGPEMVAGWPPGRRGADDHKSQAGGELNEADVVHNLSRLLVRNAGKGDSHRLAEQLAALALAPDSKQLQQAIADELREPSTPAAADPVTQDREWRKQALRLAEAHPDPRTKEMLSDYLGKLDTLMREAAPKTGKTAKTRHQG